MEYERWLIARGNVFAPSGAGIAKLVAKLRAEKFIIDPKSADFSKLRFKGKRAENAKTSGGYAIRSVANTFGKDLAAKIAGSTEPQPAELTKDWLDDESREELRLVFPVDTDAPSPLKYPLTHQPDGGVVSYAIELHRSLEFVYPISDDIEMVPTECRCGDDLAFDWDDDEIVNPFGATTGIYAECDACSRTFDPSKGSAEVTNRFAETTSEVAGGAAYRFALKVDCGKNVKAEPSLAFVPELVTILSTEFGRDFYEVGSVY